MGTILIVDDSSEIIDLLSDLLSESGYMVFSETSASEGYAAAERILPDLILCDILMPKNDGYSFLKMINLNKKTSAIPVVFISAKAEKNEILRAIEAGAADYITKPYDSRELLKLISDLMAGRNTSLYEKDIAD